MGTTTTSSVATTTSTVAAPVEGPALAEGHASYYADRFEGRPTASGVPYDPEEPTCAHRRLPFGTEVEVLRLATGERARCVVNDRGPFHPDRVIDLSRSVAESLEIDGVAKVELRRVPEEERILDEELAEP